MGSIPIKSTCLPPALLCTNSDCQDTLSIFMFSSIDLSADIKAFYAVLRAAWLQYEDLAKVPK